MLFKIVSFDGRCAAEMHGRCASWLRRREEEWMWKQQMCSEIVQDNFGIRTTIVTRWPARLQMSESLDDDSNLFGAKGTITIFIIKVKQKVASFRPARSRQ